MRTFDRSFIASALVLVGVACAPVVACSSSDSDTPTVGSRLSPTILSF